MFNDMIGSIEFDVTRLMMKAQFTNKNVHVRNTVFQQLRLAILQRNKIFQQALICHKWNVTIYVHCGSGRNLKTVTNVT